MMIRLKVIAIEIMLYVANEVINKIPSHALRILFYRSVLGIKIGKGTAIFLGTRFDTRGMFSIGCNSVINRSCRIDNRGGVYIGDNVSISSDVQILTADHDPNISCFPGRVREVKIEDYAFVGTRAIILPGVTLGYGCIVAAGAVVTKNVSSFEMVAGVPAKQIGWRDKSPNYSASYFRLFQ